MSKKIKTIRVIKEEVIGRFPNSEYPCLEYSKYLIENGEPKNSRLEVWNNSRPIPEADWVVANIGKYVKDYDLVKKQGIREPRLQIECL